MSGLTVGDIPIIVAPMAGGPSVPRLVAAAAQCGALGFLAGGYQSAEALAAEITATRSLTPHFGVNVFVPETVAVDREAIIRYRERLRPFAEHYRVDLAEIRWADDDQWADKIALLVADPVPWVSFAFGIPDPGVIAKIRRAGSKVLITVTNVDEAELAADAGADAVIAQSGEAGGHSSTTNPELYLADSSTRQLLAEIRSRIALPVVAAGGVGTRSQFDAALGGRALAVQIGTLFLGAAEAGTSQVRRDVVGDPRFAQTVVTRAFTGRPARAIRNRFTDVFTEGAPLGYPAVHYLTAPIRAAATAQGDPHGLSLWAGTGVGYAREASTAEIIGTLID